MKPRTKFQKGVVKQSNKLATISSKQKEWAFKNCFKHQARRLKNGSLNCLECGYAWVDKQSIKQGTTECICPQCKDKLSILDTQKQSFKQTEYFEIITTFNGYQVLRYFFLEKECKVGCQSKRYCFEVVQYWIAPNGKTEVMARPRNMYYDVWGWYSDLEIRKESFSHQIKPTATYPYKKYISELKRNGFCGEYHNISPYHLFRDILKFQCMETMLKCKQIELLRYFSIVGLRLIEDYWGSIKICIRNKYTITDASLWRDYIDLLKFFNKDILNARYVCPNNLKSVHDKYLKKRRDYKRREDMELQKQIAIENDHLFKKSKSKFFGISFGNELINIEVLNSVQAYFEEGESLHHCVHTSKYFLKDNSLVLSARINKKRVETVEVDLATFEVVQSRGAFNQNTEFHDTIIELVNRNMYVIEGKMNV